MLLLLFCTAAAASLCGSCVCRGRVRGLGHLRGEGRMTDMGCRQALLLSLSLSPCLCLFSLDDQFYSCQTEKGVIQKGERCIFSQWVQWVFVPVWNTAGTMESHQLVPCQSIPPFYFLLYRGNSPLEQEGLNPLLLKDHVHAIHAVHLDPTCS